MTGLYSSAPEAPRWGLAAGIAASAHVVFGAVLLVQHGTAIPPVPEPVMIVELPGAPPAASAPMAEAEATPELTPQLPDMTPPRIDLAHVDAPLPPDPVVLPPPRPVQPVMSVPRPNAAPAPAPVRTTQPASPASPARPAANADNRGAGTETSEAENGWYAQISAHLERNKHYPREARQAGQQGTPVVRFSVDRRGRVTNVSIRQSSGHELLDEATLSLMRRVSPLPPMPRSMQRETVTITLPIEYSLSRK